MHPNFLEFALFQCGNMQKVCACDTFLITTVAKQRYLIFPKKNRSQFRFFCQKPSPEEEVNKKECLPKKGRAKSEVTNKMHDCVALV